MKRENGREKTPVVVLALDGSETSRRALEPAQKIAQALGAEVDVLYVVESPLVQADRVPVLVGDFRQAGTWNEDLSSAYLEGHWDEIPGATVYVGFGRPAREIVCFAAERDATLIVLATHGRTGLPRAVLGSVAEECVRNSHVPVLVIPSPEKKPPRRGRKTRPRPATTVIGGRRVPRP